MTSFEGMGPEEATAFAARWLPAWTGNDPDHLLSFYTDDAFYSDPAIPGGLTGRDALRRYFAALLGRFPDWEWSNLEAIPMQGGFLNVWRARIPIAGSETEVSCEGLCTVELRDGLIARNRVYFDRSELLVALTEAGRG